MDYGTMHTGKWTMTATHASEIKPCPPAPPYNSLPAFNFQPQTFSFSVLTPLSSTLTRPSRKSIKTGDFNSIRCHTYETPSLKFFRINTYKKGVGVASDSCEGRSGRPERCQRVPIPSGGEGVFPGPNKAASPICRFSSAMVASQCCPLLRYPDYARASALADAPCYPSKAAE